MSAIENPQAFTALGRSGSKPSKKLETFPTPPGVDSVRFETEEFTSFCPVTHQPDFGRIVIDYVPAERCVESKSLKLYLWSFREEASFGETLAAAMVADLRAALEPRELRVEVHQNVRGGLQMTATAVYRAEG